MKRTALLLAGIFISLTTTFAQVSDELGIFLGGSYYIGELNPTTHFGTLTRPALGVIYRHNINMRLAIAGDLLFGSVQGIDSRSTSIEQQKRNLSFRSPIYELGARAEFNFLEYKIGDDKYPFAPFIFLGVAMFNFKPEASIGNQWVALQPLKTEGQNKAYMRTQISIPFGAGFRTNLAKRIGLVAEWGMRKTFTDYIDDVSTTYADPAVLYANGGALAVALADRSTTANDVGRQRGNPRNKDWYSFAGLTLTFQLAGHPKHCTAYNY